MKLVSVALTIIFLFSMFSVGVGLAEQGILFSVRGVFSCLFFGFLVFLLTAFVLSPALFVLGIIGRVFEKATK